MHQDKFPTYFRDDFFLLGRMQRLIVKALGIGVYGLLTVTAALFVSSEIGRQKWLGFLAIIFLADRLLQARYGEMRINGRVVRALTKPDEFNTAPYFQDRTKNFMERALGRSELSGSILFNVLDELLGVAEVRKGMARLTMAGPDLRAALAEEVGANSGAEAGKTLTDELFAIANLAFRESIYLGEPAVSPVALFLGCLSADPDALTKIFSRFNFSEEDFHNAVIFGRLAQGLGRKMLREPAVVAGRRRVPTRIMNRAWTSRPTPLLDQVSEDLTAAARVNALGFLIGHDEEYRAMVSVLSREGKNNALLVGEAGTGKETIVQHLAFQISRDEVPPKLFDRRLIALNLAAVTAGAQTAGEIQGRLERLVNEILLAGNIVLYIPDIHNLKLTSGEGLSAFDYMEPIFAASAIPVIGDSTPAEYRRVIEPDSDFRSLFDLIRVDELSESDALRYLTYQSFILEAKWRITIAYRALRRAVELAHRYLRDKPLPSSAVDLLQGALVEAKNRNKKILTEDDVADLVSRRTKIPMGLAIKAEAEKLLDLEKQIHERLINQEEAVKAVSSAMRQYRAGLSREKGPIAAFLFVGPTGVGKTELSKALADIYFGSEDSMIRFDMSAYQEPKSIWNFIGSPDGAVKGNLTEAAKAKPFSLILLDEFEKAHSDIMELFLPLFDEGRLADSLGNTIDFTNTIIICTSNAHSELIKSEIEKGTAIADIGSLVKKRLTEYFKPELINRFDATIVFRPLTLAEIRQIAQLQLKKLFSRLEEDRGISAVVDPEVSELLAKLGWDPVFGARPLRGVINNKISDPLARLLLEQNLGRGDKIKVGVSGEDIVIEKT